MKVFTKEGSTVVLESWNGNTLLKSMVAQCICRIDRWGKVYYPAGSKLNKKEACHEMSKLW